VSLAFVPTVIASNRISLKVRPEVSQLTTQGAVAISNGNLTLAVPALTVRRAETTVELGSGQSFAIAGLLSEGVDVRRGDLDDAAKALRRTVSPHVLVIDISGKAQPITALTELSQLVEPDVRVLAIGDKEDISLYRGLTHGLGVLEYLFKPLTRDLVRLHFGPVIDRQPLGARLLRGGRIGVTGVHGGVGATTIAANLAWYLAERAHRPTLLLDGDLYGASAAMMLSVKSQRGLRVALESPNRVDELFIDRTAQVVGERLHVLSGEGKLGEVPPVASGALTGLMDLLRRRYKFLVCDAPMPASRIGRELFDLAHQRILVTEPTLAGARDLLRYLAIPEPVIVQVGRQRDGGRRVLQVTELVGLEGEVMTTHDIFAFEHEGEDADGRLLGQWRASRAVPSFHERLRYFGLDRAWDAVMEEAAPP
jgi:pilus assembly protein CpaE